MPTHNLYDAQGQPVRLGQSLGRGGEGEVFAVPANPSLVAKVYHSLPGKEKSEKIAAMAALASPELLSIAAWPMGTLHTMAGGPVAGLLMPRVENHREIHALYSPAQRKQDFPKADWAFLVYTAENVARAFANVHGGGHVIGDVNQGNVVVSPTTTVKLIDCDSFQIHAYGRCFPCEVGVAHFTPPELQGKSFRGIVRTQDHDRFGLAVLLFHLLFMGRHPFAGRFFGRGDMPLERAITENRFAYGRSASSYQMGAPPHVLTLAQVTGRIAELFEQAFAPPGRDARPTADKWVQALQELRAGLRTCPNHGGHRFADNLRSCPWCAIEQGGGPDFFVAIAVAAVAGPSFDLDRLWRDVESIAVPPQVLPPALLQPQAVGIGRPLPKGTAWAKPMSRVAGVFAVLLFLFAMGGEPIIFLAALVLGGTGMLLARYGDNHPEKTARRKAAQEAAAKHKAAVTRWMSEAGGIGRQVADIRRELARLRDQYRSIPSDYQRDRAALQSRIRELQMQRFLEQFLIEKASIRRIGDARKDALASFGIETAADVDLGAIVQVPGFGPTLAGELVAWRATLERRFVFDPKVGVHPADIAALNRRYSAKRQTLQREMVERAGHLRRLSTAGIQVSKNAEQDVRETARVLGQALADANFT